MEYLIATLIPSALLFAWMSPPFTWAWRHRRAHRARFVQIAHLFGLRFIRARRWARERVEGTLNGTYVVLDTTLVRGVTCTRVRCTHQEFPPNLSMRRRRFDCRRGRRSRGPGLRIGDPSFDAHVFVEGDSLSALTRLTPENRIRLRHFLSMGGTAVKAGVVSCVLHGVAAEPYTLVRAVQEMDTLLRGLVDAGDLEPTALFTRLKSEHEEVAKGLFRCLREHAPGRARDVATRLIEAPEDIPAALAVQAAIALGVDGASTLERLLTGGALEPGDRLDALRYLEVHTPTRALRWVLGVAPSRESSEFLVMVAQILGRLPNEASETLLLRLLAHSERRVQVSAAQSLTHAGSLRAMKPLATYATTMATDARLRSAAFSAAKGIHARLGLGDRSIPIAPRCEEITTAPLNTVRPARALKRSPGRDGQTCRVEAKRGDVLSANDHTCPQLVSRR